jgi:hypothetical protein
MAKQTTETLQRSASYEIISKMKEKVRGLKKEEEYLVTVSYKEFSGNCLPEIVLWPSNEIQSTVHYTG